MKVLIAGGGTGGHIYPALAIADALRAKDPDIHIRFAGARGRMEMEKVPQAGYAITGLPVAGWNRKNPLRNIFFPLRLVASLWLSWRLLSGFRPDVAVGVGGYASGPALKVAGWMGIPYVIQEQNSYAGMTNRLLARKAVSICVAWEGMDRYFPAGKLVITGNPLRRQIVQPEMAAGDARRMLGLDPDKTTVVVMGGSLGAPSLNEAVIRHASWWENHPDWQLLWQCGNAHHAHCEQAQVSHLPNVRLTPFLQEMGQVYAAADLIIARAGAMTIAELCQVGKPVLLVPSPHVAEDHQTMNARELEKVGATVMIPDRQAGERIFNEAELLLGDQDRILRMQQALRQRAFPDAADRVAEVIYKVAQNRNQ